MTKVKGGKEVSELCFSLEGHDKGKRDYSKNKKERRVERKN